MKTWLAATWDSLRRGFWFVPTLLTLLALASAALLPIVDAALDIEKQTYFAWLATTASAARATLASLVGALVTIAGVVFSITMVTLSLTASQFGSRLLRTFMNQNVTQVTLGAFLGTSIYCLVILKALPSGEGDAHVPHLSVALGMALAVTCLGLLIFFIHNIAGSIQAQDVVRTVAAESFTLHRSCTWKTTFSPQAISARASSSIPSADF